MTDADIMDQPPGWAFAVGRRIVGSGVRSLFSLRCWRLVVVNQYVYERPFTSFELVVSPIVGAFLGALGGGIFRLIWPLPYWRRGRLTIARLMLVVRIVGAMFALLGEFAVLVLANTLLLLPVMIADF